MWQQSKYENKLVGAVIFIVIIVLAVVAVRLYQTNIVTFGLKHLNAAGCPGDESAITPAAGSSWPNKECVKPAGHDKNVMDCSKVTDGNYTTPDGNTGTCFEGEATPTLN
jgi:hypothetical protein